MDHQFDGIYYENLIKAASQFESFRCDMITERDKAGAVQAFEYSYELAWKIMKRVLESKGVDTESPKDTFRQAALNKLISSPEPWFIFQLKRNLTVHTYRLETLNEVLGIFDDFSRCLSEFIQNLKDLS